MFKGILSFGFIVLLVGIAQAKTIHVPGDFNKIQDAINAASGGDTVLVAPGTYVENIDFLGKAITVTSVQGANVTAINGNQDGSVVTFRSGEGLDSVFDGFTITNGTGFNVNHWSFGGGIYCNLSSSPSIKKNIIWGNYAIFGTAICCVEYSSPNISNNIIEQNLSTNFGTIYLNQSTSTILSNTIRNNSAPGIHSEAGAPNILDNVISDNSGGGIYCTGDANILNNIISGNCAFKGGGIFCTSSVTIFNNLIFKNTANGYMTAEGGGIWCAHSPLIINNTIWNNLVDENSFYGGGGISCCYEGSPIVVNTILWNNEAPNGSEIWIDDDLKISYSTIKGGKDSIYICSGGSLNWGPGMMDSEPLFVDSAKNDLHLTWLSPCINRGTNDNAPSEDIDGDPRPYMGTADMGAYEFIGTHSLEADIFAISESSGGILNFNLNGGIPNAGRNYLIYGSISGTVPGTSLPGGLATLPINWDMFTNIVADVTYPDSIIFTGFFGTLNSTGQMNAVFDTNGSVPGMAGYTVSFAYPLQGPPWDFVSNPINIEVVQ